MADLSIKNEPVSTLTVDLLGIEYVIKPPKSALGIKVARMAKDPKSDALDVIDGLFEWLDLAFGKNAAKVKKRLDAKGDPLDYPHLVTLVKAVMEKQTGDPTT